MPRKLNGSETAQAVPPAHMNTPNHADITRLVQAMSEGRAGAADALVPLIYKELHAIASHALHKEIPSDCGEHGVVAGAANVYCRSFGTF